MSRDVAFVTCRAKQVSERIYRNHLKTRFSNIKERQKLTSHILELDKQEKVCWNDLDHRRKELEERYARIARAREAALLSNTALRRGSTHSTVSSNSSTSSKKKLDPTKRVHLARTKRPSYSSLLNPFISDKHEYEHTLGYAQHMTKKLTRKSSTAQEDIGLSDINEMSPYRRAPVGTNTTRDKTRLIKGLQSKQTAKRERPKMNMNTNRPSRKISTLPPAILEEREEDGARYIRIPECRTPASTISEEEEELFVRPPSPKLTYEDQLRSVEGFVTRDEISLPQLLPLPSELPNKYRRGSKSMSALEMMKHLPSKSLSRCYSQERHTLKDRLSLFSAKMENMKCEHEEIKDIEIEPGAQMAPPPRDEFASRESKSPDPPRISARISTVDFYGLGKWRQTMAEQDHIPEILRCRYIRKPGKPVYNFGTGKFEDIGEDDGAGIPLPPLEIVNESKENMSDLKRQESGSFVPNPDQQRRDSFAPPPDRRQSFADRRKSMSDPRAPKLLQRRESIQRCETIHRKDESLELIEETGLFSSEKRLSVHLDRNVSNCEAEFTDDKVVTKGKQFHEVVMMLLSDKRRAEEAAKLNSAVP